MILWPSISLGITKTDQRTCRITVGDRVCNEILPDSRVLSLTGSGGLGPARAPVHSQPTLQKYLRNTWCRFSRSRRSVNVRGDSSRLVGRSGLFSQRVGYRHRDVHRSSCSSRSAIRPRGGDTTGRELAPEVSLALQLPIPDVPELHLEWRAYVHLKPKQTFESAVLRILVDQHRYQSTIQELH